MRPRTEGASMIYCSIQWKRAGYQTINYLLEKTRFSIQEYGFLSRMTRDVLAEIESFAKETDWK